MYIGKTFKADMASSWHDTVRLQMYKEIWNFKQYRVGVGVGVGRKGAGGGDMYTSAPCTFLIMLNVGPADYMKSVIIYCAKIKRRQAKSHSACK